MHCRVTLRPALKGTAGAVPVALRHGFLSMDGKTFLTRQSWPERTEITIRSISHAPIKETVSVRLVGYASACPTLTSYSMFRDWQGLFRVQGRRGHRVCRQSHRGKKKFAHFHTFTNSRMLNLEISSESSKFLSAMTARYDGSRSATS